MDSGKTLFDFSVHTIDEQAASLADYKGTAKAFLIVNVASACGYTDKDYKELCQLYTELHANGLEIFGFPCNQFGAQESKCNLDIKKFAKEKYKVEFPMFSKLDVNGEGADPLYAWLRSQAKIEKINWNFEKFIVDRDGKFVSYHIHSENPLSFKDEIEAQLH